MNKRRLAYFLLTLGVAALAAWYLGAVPGMDDDAAGVVSAVQEAGREIGLADGAGEGSGPQALEEELAALAMRDIMLRQGEGGAELWRLRAEWGAMRQEGGLMVLEKPRFTSIMDDGQEVVVSAREGDIDQENQVIRFIGDAEAVMGESVLRGNIMVYDGASRTMTLPEPPADYLGPDMRMRAATVVWFLDERRLEADGGVVVDWNREDLFRPEDGDDSE